MIDTGSDISLIKINKCYRNTKINQDRQCKITGITENETYTLGTIHSNLILDNCTFYHELHIVANEFPIPTDGIIGRDFLNKFRFKIDYENYTLSARVGENHVELPLILSTTECNNIHIPARCEIICALNIPRDTDVIIQKEELKPGIFVGSSIVPKEGIAHAIFINTTENETIVKNFKPIISRIHKNEQIIVDNKNLETRIKNLEKILQIEGQDTSANEKILNICRKYQDIFLLDNDTLSVNNFYKQDIITTEHTPVYIKNYRQPFSQKQEINSQISKLIKNDIIEPSVSPYNSPILLVPKKDQNGSKEWRLVVDFRKLNKVVINDKFPLTRLEDILDQLGRAKYFSTLDLSNSFHQIELNETSRHLTAFSSDQGHYQFKRLPFGLKISSNSFQRMLSIALAGLQGKSFLYVDDIIVHGCSLEHHNRNLVSTFESLRKYNLKLNPKKCNFLKNAVVYLGHLITDEGVKTDPSKFDKIKNYPSPKNADEVHRFTALCNYYRKFVPQFAKIAKPLYNLQKKKVPFNWSSDCEIAFKELKEKLISAPILKYPDWNKEFILTTDASNYAYGAVLSQGEIGNDLPIAYASKNLTKHEINKDVLQKELLAIHWGINYFRPYLYGRKFKVVTDHRPLVSLFSDNKPSSKMTRVRQDLCEYEYEIVYRKGSLNVVADALSRIRWDSDMLKTLIPADSEIKVITRSMTNKPRNETGDEKNVPIENQMKPDQLHIWEGNNFSEIKNVRKLKFIIKNGATKVSYNKNKNEVQISISKTLPELDLVLEKLIESMFRNNVKELSMRTDDEIFKEISRENFKKLYEKVCTKYNKSNEKLRIIIFQAPKELKDENEIMEKIKMYHDTPIGGHVGTRRLIKKLKQKYIFKNMNKIVNRYVKNCDICARTKVTKHNREALSITDTPDSSFQVVSIDTVGPLLPSNSYRYILTIQCELTKYLITIPITDKSAITIAKAIVDNCILKYGNFTAIKTDLGTEFVNEIFTNLCKTLKIEHRKSTPYHHQTLGTVERNHRVMNEYLLAFANNNDWDEWVKFYTFCYNTTPHTDTNYSPFELIFGKTANLPNDITLDTNKIYNFDDYIKEFKFRLALAHQKTKQLLETVKRKRQEISKQNCTNNEFNVGQWVLVRNSDRRKYENPYDGPYEISDIDNVNVTLKIKEKLKTIHKDRLKPYNCKTD